MRRVTSIFFLLLVVLAGAAFRLYHLDSNPSSPYWEEVALGYDAYSIVKTGKDFHGNPYPVIAFPSYGDYKPSLYFYAVAPFVKLLGLNVWAVRLPSALAGILSIVWLYLIGKELFDERTGLIAAAIFAISPWAIQFSRGGWEVNLAVMFTLAGTYGLLHAWKRSWSLPIAVIGFGLSMYTYHAARLFAPLIGGIGGAGLVLKWIWNAQKSKGSRKFLLPLLVAVTLALAFVMPFILNLNNREVSSRFTQTTVLSDLDPVLSSNAQIDSHGRTLLARIVYHRYWYYAAVVIQGWASHFKPEFLFVRADGNLRHWNGSTGLLYPLDVIFIALALLILFISGKEKSLGKLKGGILGALIWIGLAGIPAALVKPTPHALRFLFAAPAFCLLTAVGLSVFLRWLPKKGQRLIMTMIVFSYAYLFSSYFYAYMTNYPLRAARDWQFGYREALASLAREKKPGEKVYMTRDEGRPSMFYLFFSKYDPAKIQAAGASLPKDQLELLQVGDYFFVDTLSADPGLYATPEGKVGMKAHILDTIRRPDGSTAWVIWRR